MSIQLGFQSNDLGLATWRAVFAEFVATALLVLVGTGAVVSAISTLDGADSASFIVAVALAFGISYAVLVAATARISGGHINPAVTFAAVMSGRMKVSTGTLYVVAQIAGAIVGSLLVKTIIAGPFEGHLGANALSVYNGSSGLLSSEVGDGAGAALLLEAGFTFLLVFVVFATAIDPKGPRQLAPFAIGLAVLVAHLVCIPMTGTSINPARSFGPAVAANFWTDHWVFWLGPLIGAGVAALVYETGFLTPEQRETDAAPTSTRRDPIL